jgi:long-chain acyl-CoA synthetase
MRGETILITGATGLIGEAVLRNLVAAPGTVGRAYVLVRDPRASNVVGRSHPRSAPPAVAVTGDITLAGLGLDPSVREEITRTATMVIHCAADTSFSQTLAHARAVNTAGTANILALAAEMPSLRRFVHVSTAFVAGMVTGRVLEGDNGAPSAWVNAYEQSPRSTPCIARCASTITAWPR